MLGPEQLSSLLGSTRELLAWFEATLSYLPLVYSVPFFSNAMLKLAATLDAVFGGGTNEHAAQ